MKYITNDEINQICASMRDCGAPVNIWPNAMEIRCAKPFAEVIGCAMNCTKSLADVILKGEIRGGALYCRFIKK